MIEILPFEPEHMIDIKKEDMDAKVLMFIDDLDSRAVEYAKSGPAITMMEGGNVLAVGGVVKFWQGVGEAWLMVSPDGRKKKLALFRYMELFLQDCFQVYGFHRIQTSILSDYKEAHKCAFRLGFIPEGMAIYYGPNKENFVRYVRV